MPPSLSDRLEVRIPPDIKDRVRQAAEARGESVTRFAINALTHAANEALNPGSGRARRSLGWAAGTAREVGDILGPAAEHDEWDALRE